MMITQLVPHTDPVDGLYRASLDFTTGLAALGGSSLVLTLRHGAGRDAWEKVAVVREAMPFLECSPLRPVSTARVARIARQLPARANTVVAHRIDLINAGAIISLRQKAPFVLHAHNAPPNWLRWNDRCWALGARVIRKVIVASQFMRDAWEAVAPAGLPIDVVEYPIACDFFDLPSSAARLAARESFAVTRATLVLGYFGRLEEEKGVHILAAAAAELAKGRPVHVLIQGSPNPNVSTGEAARYRAMCDAAFAGVPHTWLASNPDVRPVIAASDLIVVPSTWAEPSGLAVSEALATGTPVVASRTGGIPAQMPESPLVALVEPGRPGELADAVRRVASVSPTDERRLTLRQHVATRRSRTAAAQSYLTALEAIAA